MKLSKLCLGTAQLGMVYGINNQTGKPRLKEAEDIITTALKGGINCFDTAPEYGDAELLLGKLLCGREVVFISKIPPAAWSRKNVSLSKQLHTTLKRLGIKKLPILLFHRFSDVIEQHGLLLKELRAMQARGLVIKWGVSIYTPEEAEQALSLGAEAIQFPFNLLDKRLLVSGFLKQAHSRGVVLLARSVFLQGLFFMHQVPDSLARFQPYIEGINRICKQFSMEVAELALRYVLSIPQISSVLIGVELAEQLKKNLEHSMKGPLPQEVMKYIEALGTAPEGLANPSLWKT